MGRGKRKERLCASLEREKATQPAWRHLLEMGLAEQPEEEAMPCHAIPHEVVSMASIGGGTWRLNQADMKTSVLPPSRDEVGQAWNLPIRKKQPLIFYLFFFPSFSPGLSSSAVKINIRTSLEMDNTLVHGWRRRERKRVEQPYLKPQTR